MSDIRIIFTSATTQELKFAGATVATDGALTVVLQNGERRFCVPTANVVAIESVPHSAPAPEPEPQPIPA